MMLARWSGWIRNHAGSAGWLALEQGAHPLLQLVLTPVLLRSLGREPFAVWVLGITLIGLSQLVSAGAGFATIKHVSADLGAARPADARQIVRTALTLPLVGGSLAAGLAVLFAPFLARVFASMGSAAELVPVLTGCGAGMLINEIDAVCASALRGAQRFDLAARAESGCRVLMAGAIAALAVLGTGVTSLFLTWLALMAVKAVVKAVTVARLFGSPMVLLPSFHREPLRRLLRFGMWQWLQAVGTTVFNTADQLLVGSLLGATALTRYSVCLQIAQYVHLVPSVLLQVIFPRLSARGAAVGAARGNEILRAATALALGIALLLGAGVALLAAPLLGLWVGPAFAAENTGLLRLLVAAHVVLGANIGGYYVLLATGRAARTALVLLGAGVAQMGTMLLVAPFGLMAVAASRFTFSLLTATLARLARYRA
ncbi:MAG: oligosaccharide flippase family protein [Proteobacteria bacterium]|nr:oligosaccharide flippase family protein [Pseudomonadota bacterium]